MYRRKIALALTVVFVANLVSAAAVTAASTSDPSVLNGTYRISWTETELLAHGVNARYAHSVYGVTTLTLRNGRFLWHPASHPPDCKNGHYAITGRRFFIDFRGTGCYGTLTATWSLGHAQLRFDVLKSTPAHDTPSDRVFFGGKPWRKIG